MTTKNSEPKKPEPEKIEVDTTDALMSYAEPREDMVALAQADRRPAPAQTARPDRIGKVYVGVHTSRELHRRLRILAAEEEREIKSLLLEGINRVLQARGLPEADE